MESPNRKLLKGTMYTEYENLYNYFLLFLPMMLSLNLLGILKLGIIYIYIGRYYHNVSFVVLPAFFRGVSMHVTPR